MYDVGATKNRKLVFGVATAAIVLIGGYIPVFAIQFQVRARARRATRGRGRDARIPYRDARGDLARAVETDERDDRARESQQNKTKA